MRSTSKQHDTTAQCPPEPTFNVLVVEDDADVRQSLMDLLADDHLTVLAVDCLADARKVIDENLLDLVLLDLNLPDGNGVELAGELDQRYPNVQTIAITGQPSLDRAMAAIRAGATDFITKPIDMTELNERVDHALRRRLNDADRDEQLARLKRLCKKLNKARHEITQQVDILCNDLVTAYQELASQMQHVEISTEFRSIIQDELDLEQLLRRVLEFTLDKIGPTNAVVFLPDHGGGFAVGGYVNYTQDKDSSGFLLDHLADVVAPRIADQHEPVCLTDNEGIEQWIGDDAAYLADSHVLAAGCRDEDDVLACVLLFRDTNEPFEASHFEFIRAVTPVFAQHLVKVIHVHHRRVDLFGEEDDGGMPA